MDFNLTEAIQYQKEVVRKNELYLKDMKLREASRDELYKILYKKKINMQCELDCCPDERLKTLYDEVQTLKKEKNRISSKHYYYWITFNFKSDIKMADILKFTDKLLSKKWIHEATYCYEQRGETAEECGKGIHMHILIPRNNFKTTHAKREVYNTFKTYTGISQSVFNDKCFKSIPYAWGADKIDYMSGVKWDKEKEKKIEIDILFREKNNLSIVYTYNALEESNERLS